LSSPSVQRKRSDARITFAFAAVLLLLSAAPQARAATIDVFAGGLGGANHAFGSLTETDWRVRAGKGVEVGLDWFLTDHISAMVSSGSERELVRVNGHSVGEFRSIPSSAIFEYHAFAGSIEPYAGVGVAYLVFRGRRGTAFGHVDPPDHAALMTNAGINYVIAPRWRLMVGAEYGPARSTAEVRHANAPTDKVDYHQLYVTTALRYRF
jgi:outer membrane protein W